MPIEIKELHIKAVVQDDCNTNNTTPSTDPLVNNTDSIVERCVEQVLDILREKKER